MENWINIWPCFWLKTTVRWKKPENVMIGNSLMHNKHWLPFQTTCSLHSRNTVTVWLTRVGRREGNFPSCLQITKFIWLEIKSTGCGRNSGNKGLVLTLPHTLCVSGSLSISLPWALLSCAAVLLQRGNRKKSISSCEALGCCGQISTTVKETPVSIY